MIGETIGGRYEILRALGEGGMGAVFEAKHTGTGRRVALKTIHPDKVKSPQLLARFQVEARAAGSIESEYVVSKVNRSQEEQQGSIKRLTIAVMLIPPHAAGAAAPEEALGITPMEAQELVKQAVGYKEGRDQIQVSIGKGPGEIAADAVDAVAVNDGLFAGLPFGKDFVSTLRGSSLGIAGVIALVIVVVAMRRRPAKSVQPAFASLNQSSLETGDELSDIHAVAATVKAWLDEPAVIRFEGSSNPSTPQAKPA